MFERPFSVILGLLFLVAFAGGWFSLVASDGDVSALGLLDSKDGMLREVRREIVSWTRAGVSKLMTPSVRCKVVRGLKALRWSKLYEG